jgi:hypothetical protein
VAGASFGAPLVGTGMAPVVISDDNRGGFQTWLSLT